MQWDASKRQQATEESLQGNEASQILVNTAVYKPAKSVEKTTTFYIWIDNYTNLLLPVMNCITNRPLKTLSSCIISWRKTVVDSLFSFNVQNLAATAEICWVIKIWENSLQKWEVTLKAVQPGCQPGATYAGAWGSTALSSARWQVVKKRLLARAGKAAFWCPTVMIILLFWETGATGSCSGTLSSVSWRCGCWR